MAASPLFSELLSQGYGNETVLEGVVTTPATIITRPHTGAPISPGDVPFPVHLAVTVSISILVGVLFLAVYVQLIMVICFGYKLFSYQTVLLFNILFWAALRLSLYSFYFYHCCTLITSLSAGFSGWLLVSFPSVLQYFSMALLVHYFGRNLFKVYERRQAMVLLNPPYQKMRLYRLLGWLLWLLSVATFLVGNVVFYFLISNAKHNRNREERDILATLRVVLLDGLFMVNGITLGVCILLIYTSRAGKDVLEAQRVHKCWPLFMSILLILIFISRAFYDVAAVKVADMKSFGLGWTFTTDMADNEFQSDKGLNHYGYLVYFGVLVVWEVIPTYFIVVFFRVRMPSRSALTNNSISDVPQNQRHFFDNPRRYDDETEQLLHDGGSIQQRSTSARMSIPSLPVHQSSVSKAGYGSTQNLFGTGSKHGSGGNNQSSQHTPLSAIMPGTTPPQLFTSPSFFTDR